ncbi:MAG TPA: nuclear transport factor 2 family protein [Trebonia sp.]|jgi:ketosteroid isomerase-like protein|nr:nuclear transport factor 2 family protein [Trebonia sp.]
MPATCTGEALIQRYYELVDAGDVAAMVALFQPGAVYCRPGYPPMAGHAEITEFYARQRKFRSGSHHLTAVLDAGARVAVHGQFNGVLHDGAPMELRFADFFEVGDDGRFSRRDTYYFAPLG